MIVAKNTSVKTIALRFTPPGWINWSLIAVAFILGLLTDQFASESSRINLLSLPFFGVLLWNIVVYLMLLISGLRHKTSRDFLGLRAALGIIEKTATLHNTRLTKSLTSVLQPFVMHFAARAFHLAAFSYFAVSARPTPLDGRAPGLPTIPTSSTKSSRSLMVFSPTFWDRCPIF